MTKIYKRIRYRQLSDGSLLTPNFEGTYDVIRGVIKDNTVYIYTLDNIQLFVRVCEDLNEAKKLMREQLPFFGVEFLDEK
jgi:hypothetical protein